MNSTSIDKKFRYSLKKLPGSWKIYFFYFKHCVLTISKWHLPTCRTEIGEFHSIKCLFWTPIFFMITAFHTMAINIFFSRNLLNFLKIQVILAGVSRKKCDSPFLKVGFFREKPTLGYQRKKNIIFFSKFTKRDFYYVNHISRNFFIKQFFFSNFFFQIFSFGPPR